MGEDIHENNAGWHPDPAGEPHLLRYFDGTKWTTQTRPDGRVTPNQAALAHDLAYEAELATITQGWAPTVRPKEADPGWYSDPSRTGLVRFYDGRGWTPRTRNPHNHSRLRLPEFALRVHAAAISAADARATKNTAAAHSWRTRKHTIQRASRLPSQRSRVETRAHQAGYGLSVIASFVAVFLLGTYVWNTYGADKWQGHTQDQLRAELAQDFKSEGGDQTTVAHIPDPTPVTTTPAPTKKPEQAPTKAPSTQPQKKPTAPKTSTPVQQTNSRSDIQLPPRGWKAPAGRKIRNLSGTRNGEPVGRIIIPKIGLDKIMVVGTTANDLGKGPGVGRYGMLPGSPGNSIVAGHRTGWGEPFRHLDRLTYGDQIIIEIPGQSRAVYEVRATTIVTPRQTGGLRQSEGVRLTLFTCHPVSVNSHRMLIQAELIEGDWVDRAVNRSKFRTLR